MNAPKFLQTEGARLYYQISRSLYIQSSLDWCLIQLMSYTIDSSFLFLSIYKALPMISWLCCYKCSPLQDLLHSTSSTLLSFTLTLLFSFLIIVSSYLSWWCWYIFSYLQDLIHSIFSTLLSYTIDSSFSFHLEYIIFNILVVLLYIFLSPGPYPIYLFLDCCLI